MTSPAMRQDIERVYRMVDEGAELGVAVEAICGVLGRYPGELKDITCSYRLMATDTGFSQAFALDGGRLALLGAEAPVDVTVSGKEEALLLVLQRKLTPMGALLKGKVKLQGSKSGLLRLAAFL